MRVDFHRTKDEVRLRDIQIGQTFYCYDLSRSAHLLLKIFGPRVVDLEDPQRTWSDFMPTQMDYVCRVVEAKIVVEV